MGKILEKATQTAELLGGIRDEIAEADEKIVDLQSKSTANSNSITDLQEQSTVNSNSITDLQAQQSAISGRVSTLSGNISTLSGRIDALEITPPTSVSYVSSVTEGVSKQGTCFVIRKNKLIAIIQDGKIIYAPYGIVYTNSTQVTSIKVNGLVYSITKGVCYTELEIGDVIDLSEAFYNDAAVKEIGVYIDTSKVTSMESMFKKSSRGTFLKNIDISCFDTSSVTNMGSMFFGCSGLTTLDLSSFDTSSVTNMSSMFEGCKVATLDLSSFDTSNVTDMRDMFSRCEIDNIIFDVFDVTKQAGSISGGKIFYFCYLSQIGELRINNYVNLSNKKFELIQNNNLSSQKNVSKVIIANISQTTTLSHLFSTGLHLESVDLSQINTSSVTNMDYMFDYCELLTTLDVTNFNTSSVTNMAGMFRECSGLTTLDLSGFDTSSVTSMNSMFYGCSGLTTLDLSGFDTSSVTIMVSMFNGCSSLASLDLSNWNPTACTTIMSMFSGCAALHTLKFPNMGMLKADEANNASIDFSACKLGTAGEESRQALIDMFSYDRTANGLTNTLTVQLSAASKALLTAEEIAAITAKGYTIA